MKVPIGKAAKEIGVTIVTLREWEKSGKIVSERTKGGHRRFDKAIVKGAKKLFGKEGEEYGDCSQNSAPAQPCS